MIVKETKGANKVHGRIYTPKYIVQNIFDLAGYRGENILKKHVIDNSCGDGAFLVQIVNEYCLTFIKKSNDINELKNQLEKYIHGIELDEVEANRCKENLKKVAVSYGIHDFNPDVICGNTLDIHKYDHQMDFVLGNPPYVRVHNLGNSYNKIKEYKFSEGGMTDLYITFFELGLNMLNKNGILSYIAPSSWFTSVAGSKMRKYLEENKSIISICDLKHFQPFNATTYTCIATLSARSYNHIKYFLYDSENQMPKFLTELTYNDINIGNNFYFAEKNKLNFLRKINSAFILDGQIEVKNGFATLADNVFISSDFQFNSKYIIPIYKASTGQWKKCIFPYDQGKLISEAKLHEEESLHEYFLTFQNSLINRSIDKGTAWYGFGRSQGINDVFKERIAINSLLREIEDIKVEIIKPGCGIYSGLYILSSINPNTLINWLRTDEFISYVSLLGKYKSGGYYTFSSKDIKKFLNYKVMEECK